MRRKVLDRYHAIPERYSNCFAIVDGKRFAICRPSGAGNQQAGAYNNYYGCHNLGYQGIVGPNGMFLQFSGPNAGAGNDLDMLRSSDALNMIQRAIEERGLENDRFDILADKIYPQVHANGVVSLRQDRFILGEEDVAEDAAASSIRTSVEHSFSKMVNLFPFLDYKKGLKMNERAIGRFFTVGALLTNLHTCLYGSQVCDQFSTANDIILPPSLEAYMLV
jgi:nuclease HARBI1